MADTDKADKALACSGVAIGAIPLVKFKCGCIGFAPHENGHAVLLEDCNRREEEDAIWGGARHMVGKSFEPLSPAETYRLWGAVTSLIYKGYRLEEIKRALA